MLAAWERPFLDDGGDGRAPPRRVARAGEGATTRSSAWATSPTTQPLRNRLTRQQLRNCPGRIASSAGQFFPAGGRGEALNLVNARYGTELGVKAYSHVSDRFSPFATQTIPTTVHEAPYILERAPDERDRETHPRPRSC